MNNEISKNENSVSLGLIGTGKQARRLADAISSFNEARLLGVCGSSAEKAAQFLKSWTVPSDTRIYSSVTDLVSDPRIEAVVIASPDPLHFEHAMTASAAGKGIFVEKPLALRTKECNEIISSCKRSNSLLFVGYHLRYHAGVARLLEDVIENDAIGEPTHLQVEWHHKVDSEMSWRTNGSWWCRSMLTTHCLDLVLNLIKRKVTRITGSTSNERWHKAEESVSLNLTFENGATATIQNSLHRDFPLHISIRGKEGSAEGTALTSDRISDRRVVLNGNEISLEYANPFKEVVGTFIHELAKGLRSEVHGKLAVENVRILSHLNQSN